jgi:formylmethanofuran dehydrogenase subunit E
MAGARVSLEDFLRQCARLHAQLCPRQVLGVRMGVLAGRLLGLQLPQSDKRLFVFMETDGCAADGVSVATGAWVGRRTMRIMDYGKVAATFVDTQTGRAWRVHPHPQARQRAVALLPEAESPWHAQLDGYQTLPDEALLVAEPVQLTVDLDALISVAGLRVLCDGCGEEVMNAREIRRDGQNLCPGCANGNYFRKV